MAKFQIGALSLGVLMLLGARSEARPLWSVPPLSGFNGASWGNLRLGQTTFRQIQANYETGKGAYEHSTELTQPKNAPVRVDLLWDKRGDEEVLGAITLRFTANAPALSQVEALLAGETEAAPRVFPTHRFEDWSVRPFPSRGVAAFALRDAAPLLLLCAPNALEPLSQMETAETPLETREDPQANLPKHMEFGEIDFDTDLSDDLALYTSEKRRAETQIALADAQNTIAYRLGGDGIYKVRATGSNKGKKGGSISVAVSIEGNGPYGPISATGSGNDYWSWSEKEKREDRWRDENALDREVRDSFRAALSAARREAENSFARQILRSGPPSLSEVREAQWRDLIESVRSSHSRNGAADAVLR